MINPPYNKIRLRLTNQPFYILLFCWLVFYILLGFLFATVYYALDYQASGAAIHSPSAKTIYDFLYFSYTTQATVGYGDFYPLSHPARLITVIQAVLGVILNALILGITTYKFIKRTSPIYFPKNLVYDQKNSTFWFRFINWDADNVRDVSIDVSVFKDFAGAYDVVSSNVEIDYSATRLVPSIHLFALMTVKSEQQNGNGIGETVTDKDNIQLIPLHISEDVTVRISLSGYFDTTGDAFFVNKDYFLKDIKCGRFDEVNNSDIRNYSKKEKVRYIKQRFNKTKKTSVTDCINCSFFNQNCLLDVRSNLRLKNETKVSAVKTLDTDAIK